MTEKPKRRIDPMDMIRNTAFQMFQGAKAATTKSEEIQTAIQGAAVDMERVAGVLDEVGPEAQNAVIKLANIHAGLGLTAENAARMSEDFRMLSETLTSIAQRATAANTDMGNAVIKLKTIEEEPRALVENLQRIIDEQAQVIEALRNQTELQTDQTLALSALDVYRSMDFRFIGEILTSALEEPRKTAVDHLSEVALADWIATLSRKETLARLPKEARQALLDAALDAFSTESEGE